MTVKPETRGRPALSDEALAERRSAIADAARGLFQAEGYQGVSMRRVAAEAGCTTMTLYRYFQSKAELLRALWGDVFADLGAELGRATSALETKAHPLEALAQGYVAYWIANPDKYRLVFMTEGVSQDEVGVFIGDGRVQQQFGAFGQAVAELLGPEVSGSAQKAQTDLLICTLNGIAHSTITMSAYAWTDAGRLVDLALRGLLGGGENRHPESA